MIKISFVNKCKVSQYNFESVNTCLIALFETIFDEIIGYILINGVCNLTLPLPKNNNYTCELNST